jgi:RNA-splicing ligase RtcB
MIELKGKNNTAKVFTDNIDQETISQVIELLNQPFTADSQIRIMPDCHAGKGCVVGTTMTLTDKVVPNLVGVDIGCGMYAIKLEETEIDMAHLDTVINTYVPSGFSIHDHAVTDYAKLKDYTCDINVDNAKRSLGSLGGGNHFIEIDQDKDGNLWLVIHCGSRHLGIEVCDHYQKAGFKVIKDDNVKAKIDAKIAELKAKGLEREIENTIKILKMQAPNIPEHLAYVEGTLFDDYIHDMRLTQEYAKLNRETIADIIVHRMGLHPVDAFDTIHNYIDIDNMILRKGSISAQLGEKVIIPMNMRDGSLICLGKGNPDWNYSAPHGAGRIMSRGQAKDNVNFEEFKKSMEGIYSTSVVESTIDESPMVYKPIDEIMANVADTVDILDVIKPIYNFKAH